ncbi:MAG: hypothetical protein U9R14_04100, partial [Patescibacteria group bacterium]|nr:hypothetical protein [Patescibacteria group bacterium]
MKNCQEQKKQLKFNKKIFNKIVLSCLIFCLMVSGSLAILSHKANADSEIIAEQLNILESKRAKIEAEMNKPGQIGVVNRAELAAIEAEMNLLYAQLTQGKEKWSWEKLLEEFIQQLKEQRGAAFKAMLGSFLNNIAYDTATYLATGDWGQNPMFETNDIGDVLRYAADNAAGSFLEILGKGDYFAFNLCKPDFGVQIKIGLGLQKAVRPDKPVCHFSEMKKNWENELNDPNFLNKFQAMFDPFENDLGIALTLQTGMENKINKAVNEDLERLKLNQGLKAFTEGISNKLKSPVKGLDAKIDKTFDITTDKEKEYTGTLADAIGVFVNTLVSKLTDKWFKEGLVTSFPDNSYQGDWGGFESQTQSEGIAGAEDRFRELIEPEFGVRGDYEILSELVSCSDPTKAGPTNCVITENFRQAVINRMTVGQAMNQGYLNAEGIFGFTSDGLEPDYYDEGYPYRAMIILRKFRIIPVGWELAVQYIKMCPQDGLPNCDYGGTGGTKNLGDLVACYDSADDYEGYSAAWCVGLVDPSWVLKAPLNYCKREGPGPEIISEQIIGEGYDSELAISRNDNYCADEQSCIKENNDGSCQLYGYCAEERRRWLFNGNSCEPKYNTCQTFRSRAGSTASYLENTLDYSVCDIDNVGCQPYCADYDYENSNFICTADTGNKMYFDKDVEECDEDNEGCHEFIRTKAGLNANLLTNSSFEDDLAGSIWDGDGAQVDDSYDGLYALQLSNNLDKTIDAGPTDYSIAGEIWTLSFYAKNCTAIDDFSIETDTISLNQGNDWQYYQATHIYPEAVGNNQVSFVINSSSCIIDAIKLERGDTATAYSDYRGAGLVYEKLLPDYLETVCYVNPDSDYQLIDTDGDGLPDEPICADYARKCNQNEVNCELYTSVTDDFSVPAKVIAQDYCQAECVGYDTYIQSETAFDSLRDAYFIPSTAQICGAESAGCDEFTNLDEVELGGEGIEYYIYLRQCVKPSDSGADCANFYTWEGSDETGFQLRAHNLQQDSNEPAITQDDSGECDEAIYNLPATDPAYNSDCREFYNSGGEISYHLYSRTITCDDNCHPYRRTE